MRRESGFFPLMSSHGYFVWTCSACWNGRVAPAIQALNDVYGDEARHLYFNAVMHDKGDK